MFQNEKKEENCGEDDHESGGGIVEMVKKQSHNFYFNKGLVGFPNESTSLSFPSQYQIHFQTNILPLREMNLNLRIISNNFWYFLDLH